MTSGLAAGVSPPVGRSVLVLLPLAVITVLVMLVARATSRALANRVTWELVPTEGFAPGAEDLRRFTAVLAKARRPVRGLLTRSAETLRFAHIATGRDAVRFEVSAPAHAAALVEASVPHGCELRLVTEPTPALKTRHRRTPEGLVLRRYRIAGRLGRPGKGGDYGLEVLEDKPDPLGALISAMADQTPDEECRLVLDLDPIGPWQRRWRLRSALSRESRRGGGMDGVGSLFANPLATKPQGAPSWWAMSNRRASMVLMEEHAADRHRHERLVSSAAGFRPQLLIVADGPDRHRAKRRCEALLGALAPSEGRNRWRACGRDLGVRVGGAMMPWRRQGFDRRLATGQFTQPGRDAWVLGSEVAWLCRPATKEAHVANVARSGGLTFPAPVGLPTWAPGDADAWPLGWVTDPGGAQRLVAARLSETLFSAECCRSNWGKSSRAGVRAVSAMSDPSRPAVVVMDPHGDLVRELAAWAPPERLAFIDLGLPTATTMGLNPLCMVGLGVDDVEGRVNSLIGALSAAADWSDTRTGRALAIASASAETLCHLALVLPAELNPTVFQITTLVSNPTWLGAGIAHLPRYLRDFWTQQFPRYPADAVTPLMNPISRLRASRAVAALLGQPVSTFDFRRSLDGGEVVLVCPGARGGGTENLMHALFVHDLFRATMSRQDIPLDQRHPYHAFIDEVQIADGGQSSTTLEEMFRETRKMGGRLDVATQDITVLKKATQGALFTNRSHLCVSAMSDAAARVLVKEMPGELEPATIANCERHTYLASVTLGGKVSAPFRVRGVTIAETFGDPPSWPDATLDPRRRPVEAVLQDLDTLDGRISRALEALPAPGRVVAAPSPPSERPAAELPAGVGDLVARLRSDT